MKKVTEIQRGNSVLAFKAGFWYTVSNFLAKSITFLVTPIFARLMTVSDYGEFSNFSNWCITLIIITSMELQNTLSRAYYDFKDNYDDYISSVTLFGAGITAIFYLVFLLEGDVILKVVSIPKQYVHLLFFFLLFTFARVIFYARERTLYRYKTVAVISFIGVVVPTLISVFLIYFLPTTNQLSARLYGFYLPAAMIGMYCAASLFRKSHVFKLHYCKYAIALSIPLLMHYLAAYLLTSTSIIITKNMLGAGATAIVSIALSTTHIFTVLYQSLSGALTTWLMDNLEQGKKETVLKGTFYYVLLLATVVVSVILTGPEIIYILGGAKYAVSVTLIPGFMFASFILSVTTVLIIILTYDKNVKKTGIYTTIFSILNIIAKVWFLPRYGLIMLAYVNIAVFFILFIINYILVKQAGYADAICFKRIVGIMIMVGIVMALSPQIYSSTSIRYFLIGVLTIFFLIAAYLNKNSLMDFVYKLRSKRN